MHGLTAALPDTSAPPPRLPDGPAGPLTLQLLSYVGDGRPYGEVMEAWRSSCPRLSIWEDALADGLVALGHGGALRDAVVTVTARGRALLQP